MFGARCHKLLKPLIKNLWLITMITTVNNNCKSPIATWLLSKNDGSGQPHIICPIETYIRTIKNPRDAISRFLSTGVSLSSSVSPSEDDRAFCPLFPFFMAAPYPASRTAAMISPASAVPSTPIESVSRLTEQEVTPFTPETAFSTRAAQAAQLIPVTVYCSIIDLLRFLLFHQFLQSRH